jgi:hypothetical protein
VHLPAEQTLDSIAGNFVFACVWACALSSCVSLCASLCVRLCVSMRVSLCASLLCAIPCVSLCASQCVNPYLSLRTWEPVHVGTCEQTLTVVNNNERVWHQAEDYVYHTTASQLHLCCC